MTLEEAIAACWWTPNVAETRMFGSSTSAEAARFFNATLSMPREKWSNPDGPQNYDIRVSRWITKHDATSGELVRDDDGEIVMVQNPTYTLIEQEIDRRNKAAAA